MDELEILKRDWKKKENSFNQVSEQQIYGMLHKRSSSIVKWILIISILEFVILRALDVSTLFDDYYIQKFKQIHIYQFEQILTIFNFIILIFFIYKFYQSYKNINAAASVKKLMSDIISTRKIVKYYVWYNLVLIGVSTIVVLISEFTYSKQLGNLYNENKTLLVLISLFIILFMITFFGLLYKLLYGILLNRLFKNYKELEKLDL